MLRFKVGYSEFADINKVERKGDEKGGYFLSLSRSTILCTDHVDLRTNKQTGLFWFKLAVLDVNLLIECL